MCAASAVTDYYRDKWFLPVVPLSPDDVRLYPLEEFDKTIPKQPVTLPISGTYLIKPGTTITSEQWAEYQELKRRMEAYDAQTNQPDCVKPEVATWEAVVAQLVNQGEQQ